MTPTALLVPVLALALAGCATDDPPRAAPPTTSPSGTTPPAPSQDVPASRCEAVSVELLDTVAAGAEPDLGPLTFSGGAAVRSRDYPKVWMVAARFSAPDKETERVGIWATNSLDPSTGVLLSVDRVAQKFTIWPDGDKTQAEMSTGDEGVDVAKDCLAG